MNKKLSLQDLIPLFASRSGMDAKSSAVFVKAVFDIIGEYVAKDKIVKVKGLGTFKLVSVSDRESINVNTGERIVISGHTKLSFTPDSSLKDIVNRPFADFETTPLNDNTPIEVMERIPLPDSQDQPLAQEEEEAQDVRVEEKAPAEVPPVENQTGSEEEQVISPEEAKEMVEEMPTEVDETEGKTPDADIPQQAEETSSHAPLPIDVASLSGEAHRTHPSYPMAEEGILEDNGEGHRHFAYHALYIVIIIMLTAAAYFCGYYHVLDDFSIEIRKDKVPSATSSPKQRPEEQSSEPTSFADSMPEDTLTADSVQVQDAVSTEHATDSLSVSHPVVDAQEAEELAKNFPQVKNGEYWIVGDAGRVHYMDVGETLYYIARQELGDKKLMEYLRIYNNFTDPNILHTGQPIRIPVLVKKK